MKRVAVLTGVALVCFSTLALAATTPAAPETRLVQLELRAAKAATTAAGEYAKDLLDAAKSSITDAKINLAAGKEK